MGKTTDEVTIGMRVKTGRATAILLSGPLSAPCVIERNEMQLWDPRVPNSKQPYHVALDLPEKKARPIVRTATHAVYLAAARELRKAAKKVASLGYALRGVGLVIGSNGDPQRLGNLHVRAHALEGRLFWKALEQAAKGLHLPCFSVLERETYEKGAAALGRKSAKLRTDVTELGRKAGRPWGAEEKTATIAAWMAFSACAKPAPRNGRAREL